MEADETIPTDRVIVRIVVPTSYVLQHYWWKNNTMTDKNRGNSCRLVTKCGTIATAQGTAFRTTYSRLAPSTSSAWTVNPRWPDSRRWQEVKVGLAFFVRSHEECPFVLQWWCHDPQREKLFALPSKLVEILPILSDQMSHATPLSEAEYLPLKGWNWTTKLSHRWNTLERGERRMEGEMRCPTRKASCTRFCSQSQE